MKKINKNLTSFVDHFYNQYGKRGTATREKYMHEFEAFKLGVMLKELLKEKGLTQEELAEKVRNNKNIYSQNRE